MTDGTCDKLKGDAAFSFRNPATRKHRRAQVRQRVRRRQVAEERLRFRNEMRALKEQFRSILAKYRNELRQLTAEWEARFGRIERRYLQEEEEQQRRASGAQVRTDKRQPPEDECQQRHGAATDTASPQPV